MLARFLEWVGSLKGRGVPWFALPAAVAAIMAVLAVTLTYNFPALANAERYLSDLQIAGFAPSEPQDKDIFVVSINEDTMSMFPYRAPLDRKFLAELLEEIAAQNPRAIGIDYLFDQPTEEDKDELLKKTLAKIKVPIVVAYAQIDSVVNEAQKQYLEDFAPKTMRGMVNIATDQFDFVRSVYPGAQTSDGYVPSFPRAIAEKVGLKTAAEEIPIAWHGRPDANQEAFSIIPAQALKYLPANPETGKKVLDGKIVLVGSDLTLIDRHRTPYSTILKSADQSGEGLPGVVIQAHAVSQLLNSARAPEVPWSVNLGAAFVTGMVGALFGMVSWPVWRRMVAGVVFIAVYWIGSVAEYHFGAPMLALIAPTLSMGTSFFAMEAVSGNDARQQREFIKGVFSHHVAPRVVDQLLSDPAKVASLEGERREMTFLFTDVADFTTMSEGVDSKELGRVLNAYLEVMTDIVQKHGGMVDKFIGDAVFAIFNAPIDQKDHAEAAVRCGLEMDRFALGFSDDQHAKGIPFGRTRVGIHTGTAVVGNFGSRTRHNYTASGDAVNTASRLEGLNKHFGTRISVSGATHELCPHIRFRPTASVVVKGKKTAIDLYEPLQDDDTRGDFIARYCAAYEKLKEGTPEAPALFEALAQEAPEDPQVAFHLSRIHHGVMNVSVVMTEK